MELKELLQTAVRGGAEISPRTYSGRGMYGASCLAYTVTAEQMLESVAWLFQALIDEGDPEAMESAADDLRHALSKSRWDTMGRDSVVVYFPGYPDDGTGFDDPDGEEDRDG